MPVNSSALRRFRVYDILLSNTKDEYTLEDFLSKLKDAEKIERKKRGRNIKPVGIEINRRQFYKDLKVIEEEWGIEIDRVRKTDGKKIYGYKNKNSRIFARTEELLKLRDALILLRQFSGLPQFDFLEDLFVMEEGDNNATEDQRKLVAFGGNPDLEGLSCFPMLLNAIVLKKVLLIKYNSAYKKTKEIYLSPYFLKEYNNRWFLLGSEKGYKSITTLALDRIDVETLDYAPKEDYIESKVDFQKEYFEDIIGVTIPKNSQLVEVVLKFSSSRFNYVRSKPLHHSQMIKKNEAKDRIVRIKVIPNPELESLIMYYGSDVEVLEPEGLRKTIIEKILSMLKTYE